jgi:hypothetical protein
MLPSGQPMGSVACSFRLRMRIRDLNGFFESAEHEARVEGTIHFGDFTGQGEARGLSMEAPRGRFSWPGGIIWPT